MKMALQTIGKFNIKKKVGQNTQIFGRYIFAPSSDALLSSKVGRDASCGDSRINKSFNFLRPSDMLFCMSLLQK